VTNNLKILIINLLYIGDLLLATPFLRALREALPEAAIDLIIEEDYQDILRHNPNIDGLIPVRRADFRGKIRKNLDFIRQIRREHYDICIDLHGMERTTIFTAFSGAPVRGGLATHGIYGNFYTYRHKLRNDIHVAEAYLEILAKLKIPIKKSCYPLELHLPDEARRAAVVFWKKAGLRQTAKVLGIAPISRGNTKCWPVEHFTELAQLLHNTGHEIAFFGGPTDAARVSRITEKLDFKPVNFTGKTTLLEAAALIAKCAAFLSNDSSLMHFAATQHVPVVGVFGPSDPVRFHPYCEKYRVVTAPNACRKQRVCKERSCETLECLQKITAADVFRAVQELVKK
jgi:heptosyltransferase-2